MKLKRSASQALLLFLAASLAAILTFLSKPKTGEESLEQQLTRSLAENVIVDFHRRFAQSTQSFSESARTFCESPDNATYQTLRQHWVNSMSDWQAVQSINFGPIVEDNQSWRIQFWPDKKNLVGRKIKSLLNSQADITPEILSEASVVIQGLSALEYLLFDGKGGTLDRYQQHPLAERQCSLLKSSANLSHRTAEKLFTEWQDKQFLDSFLAEVKPDEDKLNQKSSALTLVMESLLASLEVVINDKVGAPLGLKNSAKKPQPFLAEAWRSQKSLDLVRAKLQSIRRLLVNGELLGITDYLIALDQQHIANKALTHLDRAIELLQEIQQPLVIAIRNETQIQILQEAHGELSQLMKLMKTDIPEALNIVLGFNDNDGD